MIRVAHLTSVHPVLDRRIQRECRTLQDAGYDVHLVAPHDRSGKVGDVNVVHVEGSQSRLRRMSLTQFQVLRRALDLRAQVYHFHDPELLLTGMALRRTGAHVIFDVHEDVEKDLLYKPWIHERLRPLVARTLPQLMHAAARRLSGIVAAWPNTGRSFAMHGTVVRNYPEVDEFATDPYKPFVDRPNHILYTGELNTSRGIHEMLAAFFILRQEFPDAQFHLAGRFEDPVLEQHVRTLATSGVFFHGWIDRDTFRAMLNNAKVGLAIAHPTPAYVTTPSTKIYEYLSAGLPAVVSDFAPWREAIDASDGGFAVDPLDPQAIAAAIARILRDPIAAQQMGERGRQAIRERFNWGEEGRRLVDFYATLAEPNAHANI